MDEYVLARLALNKTKTFRSVEPLHDTLLLLTAFPCSEFAPENSVFEPAR